MAPPPPGTNTIGRVESPPDIEVDDLAANLARLDERLAGAPPLRQQRFHGLDRARCSPARVQRRCHSGL